MSHKELVYISSIEIKKKKMVIILRIITGVDFKVQESFRMIDQ